MLRRRRRRNAPCDRTAPQKCDCVSARAAEAARFRRRPLRTAKPLPAEMHEAARLMTGTLMFLTVLLVALSLCSRMIEGWIGGLL